MSRFLGLDCCTSSMKALVLDTATQTSVAHVVVPYSQLPHAQECSHGILNNMPPLVKHTNPLLWAEALDAILAKLKESGFDMASIDGISGCAQQHSTIYLKQEFKNNSWLKTNAASLAECVAPMLSRSSSPTWMDSSTFEQCRAMDEAIGGSDRMRRLTGSSATERFSGPQIKLFAEREPDSYSQTGIIHLCSSFLCSLLTGTSAPLDVCDAAGMNLMELENRCWNKTLLQTTAPELESRLPQLATENCITGTLHPYYRKYGMKAVPVISWTADNASTIIGTGCWRPGTSVVVLGTSDNILAPTDKVSFDSTGYGHLMLTPEGRYLQLNCFKNGSCAREHVRSIFELTWEEFDNDAFDLTKPGNNSNIMLPYITDEVTPQAMNVGPIYEGNTLFKSFKDAAAVVRALVEAQAMTMRLHSGWFNNKVKTIRVTGSPSRSHGVCQVLADVFNADIERNANHAAAAQGAAMRAANMILPDAPFSTLAKLFCQVDHHNIIEPVKQNVEIYREIIKKYANLEKSITGEEIPYSNF